MPGKRENGARVPLVVRAGGAVGGLLFAAAGAWMGAGWSARLWRTGIAGRGAVGLLFVAPAVYILSWAIEFAIFGTFALGLGLILLAVAMWSHHLSDRVDRVLVTLAAVGSLTWNTETVSAFLLVGVGSVFAALCLRLGSRQESHRERTG